METSTASAGSKVLWGNIEWSQVPGHDDDDVKQLGENATELVTTMSYVPWHRLNLGT